MSVQSVERAAEILRSLAAGRKTLTELSATIGIGMPGTLKMLRTLVDCELVVRNEDGSYSLGVMCCSLARGYLQQNPITVSAYPVMDELALRLGRALVLAVLREGAQVNIMQADPHNMILDTNVPVMVGSAWPQATGRVLLAFASQPVREAHFRRYPPVRYGVTASEEECAAVFAEVRETGMARVSRAENMSFIAAPVRSYNGEVVAALGMCVQDGLPDVNRAICGGAEAISLKLGWDGKESWPDRDI